MTSIKNILRSLTLAVAALVGGTALHAVPIVGQVEMQGVITLNNSVLGSATGTIVDPVNPEAFTVGQTATGSYAGIGFNAVEWKAFSWSPVSVLPIESLWSFTSGGRTYSFDLATLNVNTHTSTFLDISGAGWLKISDGQSGPSYDDTYGVWSFQVTNSNGTSPSSAFIFQSSNSTPDGGTTALLVGVGLVGMSFVAHRRRLVKA